MKRQNSGMGMAAMKKGHEEKDMGKVMVADLKYCQEDAQEELKQSVNSLSSYVKRNKPKR